MAMPSGKSTLEWTEPNGSVGAGSNPKVLRLSSIIQAMKAMQVNTSTREPLLIAAELPQPQPREGELLIGVRAAGVTPTELLWCPTNRAQDGTPRTGAVPGHEFSGVIAAMGKDTNGFEVGQEIYGLNDWFAGGATAEFCVTKPESIAGKPSTLTHEAAATVPIGALTAWQGLLERAKIQAGERVLVHGAAGAVGIFAVQLAHNHGACVIATASAANLKLVAELGAAEVIDYRASRFEDRTQKVDVVFDAVGGETLDRSWSMLKPGGRLVTVAASGEASTDQRTKDAFFIVEPNQNQLVEVAKLLDAGSLRTFVSAVVPLAEASTAYGRAVPNKRGYGKVVVVINEQA
jgi:NADPH:quinone reductase-like Zn-dependent oxidoreductase